ncbi:BRCT domain-containing protein [Enterococcus faecium]|nr:BRCT domain-containing protein [Enterococcus faecalis]EMF0280649.1 BRCT domain-containing protein [Enterococcus faecium]
MNEVLVFTGTLDCFTRQQAQNLVKALGGRFQHTITKETTCLVAGKQPITLFDPGESLKRKQAVERQVKIISEEVFLGLCIEQLSKYRRIKAERKALSGQ